MSGTLAVSLSRDRAASPKRIDLSSKPYEDQMKILAMLAPAPALVFVQLS